MRIAIAGASGLIGTLLCQEYGRAGHEITRVVRASAGVDGSTNIVVWDPTRSELDASGLEGQDVVINLAGANLAGRRWTPQVKQQLVDSRVKPTQLMSEVLARLKQPPRLFINASAIGYYGNVPWEIAVDESAPQGAGFLAELVRSWEAAAHPAAAAGIRTVLARFGVVLDRQGGALAKLLPLFRAGLGGRLGAGTQVMSWIALADIPGALMHVTAQESISGPVNLTAPQAVTNAEFTSSLARVLKRPAIAAVPAFALRMALGEMAGMLLEGQRVVPRKLAATGFEFQHSALQPALTAILR